MLVPARSRRGTGAEIPRLTAGAGEAEAAARSPSPRSPGCRSTSCTSRRRGLSSGHRARDRGSRYAETCPHYLFVLRKIRGAGFEGEKYVMSPPLRPSGQRERMWRGLAARPPGDSTGPMTVMHEGQKSRHGNFSKIPNGAREFENADELVWDGGVRTGRILPTQRRMNSTARQRSSASFPRKGRCAGKTMRTS